MIGHFNLTGIQFLNEIAKIEGILIRCHLPPWPVVSSLSAESILRNWELMTQASIFGEARTWNFHSKLFFNINKSTIKFRFGCVVEDWRLFLGIQYKKLIYGKIFFPFCSSHVGHIFRKRSPYKWRTGVNVLKRNSIRLAEVWLDDYKTYYYERINNQLVRFFILFIIYQKVFRAIMVILNLARISAKYIIKLLFDILYIL